MGHAAVVVGHAHFENGDAQPLNPVAETVLAVPFGVPIGKEEDGGALLLPREELGVDGVVFGPGGLDGTGKDEDILLVQVVVVGGSGGVPIFAVLDGVLGVLANEGSGIGFVG